MNIELQGSRVWIELDGQRLEFTAEELLKAKDIQADHEQLGKFSKQLIKDNRRLRKIEQATLKFTKSLEGRNYDLTEAKFHLTRLFYDIDEIQRSLQK